MANSALTESKPIVAEAFSRWALDENSGLPIGAADIVARLTIDSVGLMYAARNEVYIRAIIDSAIESGAFPAIGHAVLLNSADSCLTNGTAIHGEDYDDTYEGTPVHLAASIIPSLIAVGFMTDIDRDTWVRSITLAAELVCRLVVVAPTAIHRQGFHPTGVLGAFGATAAVGIALKLTPTQLASALGIVGSMTSGIIEYLAEGTWTKRMHPGWAAASGLKAAKLAKSGFLGPRTVFEGEHGFYKAFADSSIDQDFSLLSEWGESWQFEKVAFKPFACGTMAQPFIDCAIAAKAKIDVKNIISVKAHVGEGTVHRLWEPLAEKRQPSTPYGAKFSVPYCVAVGMLYGDAGLAQFTKETLRDPGVIDFAKKVSYCVNPDDPYPSNYVGWLEIQTTDHQTHHFKQTCMRGGKYQPMTDQEIRKKFLANCIYGGLEKDQASSMLAKLDEFFSSSVMTAGSLFADLPS